MATLDLSRKFNFVWKRSGHKTNFGQAEGRLVGSSIDSAVSRSWKLKATRHHVTEMSSSNTFLFLLLHLLVRFLSSPSSSTNDAYTHPTLTQDLTNLMTSLIPALAFAIVSFLSSTFIILRIVISILPPHPLSRRVPLVRIQPGRPLSMQLIGLLFVGRIRFAQLSIPLVRR